MKYFRPAVPLLLILLCPPACQDAPPPATSPPPISRIAFGSCADEEAPQPFWDAIVAQAPELFIFAGDNVYADTEDMAVMRAAYDRLGEQPGYQRLLRNATVLATWDDHDYGVNDGGAAYPMRDLAQREFLRFFNIPESSPLWSRPGIYDAHVFGPEGRRVQVILLDTRYFRGPLTERPPGTYATAGRYVPNPDTTVTMLGEAQWTWLEEQLRQPADVRVLVSSIQVIPEEHGWEKWANLPHERERLFRLIRDTEATGLVLISGDRHLAEISRLPADDPLGVGYPLYEVTASALNRGGGGSDDEPNRYRVGPRNFRENNFGLLTIDWSEDDPSLSLEVRDEAGTLVLQETLQLGDLRAE